MSTNSEQQQLQFLVDSAQRAISDNRQVHPVQLPYSAPDRRPNPETENLDWIRAGIFILATILLALTVGAYLTSAGGRAPADLLTLSLVQEYVWPVLAVALFLSALFGLLPSQVSARRQRAVNVYPSIMAATMGCAFTFSAAFLPWTAFSLAALSCVAGLLGIRALNRHTARNLKERFFTDVPLSMMTGFSLLFTAQLFFVAAQWNGATHVVKALVGLLVVTIVASVAAHSERGRHALALGFIVGILSVAVSQWLTEASPWWLSVVSVLCGICVVLAAENRRHQITHAEHRAARGLPLGE